MAKEKVLWTERGRMIMEIFDMNCPGDDEDRKPQRVLSETEILERLSEIQESIYLWGDMISDDIRLLEFTPLDKRDSLKEDLRMCRAHLQECKEMQRKLKEDLERVKKDLDIGEYIGESEVLTA